jgi:hypothetical protein
MSVGVPADLAPLPLADCQEGRTTRHAISANHPPAGAGRQRADEADRVGCPIHARTFRPCFHLHRRRHNRPDARETAIHVEQS